MWYFPCNGWVDPSTFDGPKKQLVVTLQVGLGGGGVLLSIGQQAERDAAKFAVHCTTDGPRAPRGLLCACACALAGLSVLIAAVWRPNLDKG